VFIMGDVVEVLGEVLGRYYRRVQVQKMLSRCLWEMSSGC
jgi:hypothetical protein